jgi:uncharacterized membrane protein YraQ (UPF0718 family)
MSFLNHFFDLFLEAAPWMLLGLVIAGLLKEWIPTDLLTRHLGGKGAGTTIKAAFIGAPLPLCSCGVIPAAMGLRRSGASKSATTSFLVATPETGIDSVSVSYALMGPFMAIIRPIAAISSAIVAGLLVGKDEQRQQVKQEQASTCSSSAKSSCCSSKSTIDASVVQQVKATSSCSSSQSTPAKLTAMQKLSRGLKFAATDLVKDIATWLLIGLFFAALIQTYVETDYLAQWGGSIWSMLLMVLISIPMYICATASTPIAAGLLMSGISPGAVLVFMLAGPATNIATIGVVRKELGKRALWAYLIGVIGTALVFGFLTDYLVAQFGFSVVSISQLHEELLPAWLTIVSAVLLGGLMIRVYIQKMSANLRPAAHS